MDSPTRRNLPEPLPGLGLDPNKKNTKASKPKSKRPVCKSDPSEDSTPTLNPNTNPMLRYNTRGQGLYGMRYTARRKQEKGS